jgi:hypothetical protein
MTTVSDSMTSRSGPDRRFDEMPGVRTLLLAARHSLDDAATTSLPAQRYATAHLAALRSAAAMLAARARPVPTPAPGPAGRSVGTAGSAGRGVSGGGGRRRQRPRNAWALLIDVAPEMSEWAAFFAAGAAKRAAAEAGINGAVTAREADDLVRDSETFLALVETTIGVAHQPALPLSRSQSIDKPRIARAS